MSQSALATPTASRWFYSSLILVTVLLSLLAMVRMITQAGGTFPGFRFEPTLTVSATNEGSWNGPRLGIRAEDRLIALNGVQLRTPNQLWEAVKASPAGTSFRYEIDRNGQQIRLDIPSQVLTWSDFLVSFLAAGIIGLFNLMIGCYAYFAKPTNPSARALLLSSMFTALYLTLANEYDLTMSLARVTLPMLPLIGSAYLHLAFVFPQPRRPNAKHFVWWLCYAPMAILIAAWEYSFRAEGYAIAPDAHGIHVALVQVFCLWLILGLLGFLGKLVFVSIREKQESLKKQAQAALLGSFAAFVPIMAVVFIPAITKSTSLEGSGTLLLMSLCFLAFPLSIAFAIVRYKMFDIDVIIKRTVIYSSIVLVLTTLYFAFSGSLRYVVSTLLHTESSDFVNIVTTGLIAILFAPVRDRLQTLLDRLFKRGKFDFRQVVSDFTATARETFEVAQLFEAYHHALDRAFHPRHMSILLREGEGLQLQYSVGLPLSARPLALEPGSFAAVAQGGLTATVPTATGSETPEAEPMLYAPLAMNQELLGIVTLGPRQSDQDYTSEDRQLIDNLSQQLSLAVKTAQLVRDLAGQERIKRELEIAAEVQNGLLPKVLPVIPGLGIATFSQPALEIGGDFYDVLQLDEHTWGFIVGDVTGKGVPAALLGAVCLTVFRAVAPGSGSAAETMTQINRVLYKHRPNNKMFVSALMARYDTRTRELGIVNAGQPLPYLNDQSLAIKGLPLGVRSETPYRELVLTLEDGQRFMAISDGLEDAMRADGERFGTERIQAALLANQRQELEPAVRGVVAASTAFVAGQPPFDDITLLAIEARA